MTTKYVKEKDHHGNVLGGEILTTDAGATEGASPGVRSNQPGVNILSDETRGNVTGRGSAAITKRGGMKVIGKGRKKSR